MFLIIYTLETKMHHYFSINAIRVTKGYGGGEHRERVGGFLEYQEELILKSISNSRNTLLEIW